MYEEQTGMRACRGMGSCCQSAAVDPIPEGKRTKGKAISRREYKIRLEGRRGEGRAVPSLAIKIKAITAGRWRK